MVTKKKTAERLARSLPLRNCRYCEKPIRFSHSATATARRTNESEKGWTSLSKVKAGTDTLLYPD